MAGGQDRPPLARRVAPEKFHTILRQSVVHSWVELFENRRRSLVESGHGSPQRAAGRAADHTFRGAGGCSGAGRFARRGAVGGGLAGRAARCVGGAGAAALLLGGGAGAGGRGGRGDRGGEEDRLGLAG